MEIRLTATPQAWVRVGWLLCPDLVSFPVLSRIKLHTPLLSCPVLSCPVLSSPLLSSPLLSSPVQSCPVLSCPVLSCPVLSCPVLSCPVAAFSLFGYTQGVGVSVSRLPASLFEHLSMGQARNPPTLGTTLCVSRALMPTLAV